MFGIGRRPPASSRWRSSVILALSLLQLLSVAYAHFIQIDNNAFRNNYFPRPPIDPPAPAPPSLAQAEQLTRHFDARQLSPAELMADLSNDLTYRMLHYHSILNRNNFAFSPTALMSVLIALYEGSAGRSALELHKVLMLPNSRDVIRVGYRDIHRKLRTYFFESENPLKGLSLNKDNVTITHGYEAVLTFYGYDLGMDMVSSTVSSPSSTTPIANITDEITKATTTSSPKTYTTSIPNNTMEDNTEKITTKENDINTTTKPEKTSTTPTTTTETETTVISTTPEDTTTEKITTSTETLTTEKITTVTPPTTTTAITEESTTETNDETTTITNAPITEINEDVAEFVPAIPIELNTSPFQRLQKVRPIHTPSSKLQAPISPISTPKHNYLPQYARSRSGRHKRHSSGFKEMDTNLFVTLFSPQPALHHDFYAITQPITGSTALGQYTGEFDVETLDTRLLKVANGRSNYGYNTDVISHVFYLGSQQLVHTTFKVYNAVLYFKYFEDLKMSALELELDTPDYNLIILLPDSPVDLISTTASLGLTPSLRLMRKQLKPRWVQAIIPDFKLHGTIFLTNDLQNMGVCDIFEPNRADFRPMTDEKAIYVKHIEQSINVNIRTHPINQLKRNYGPQTSPIQISVNHPFLFFVIDRDLDVAVMAGRILNPLNVRIQ
ncbi:uncharacterized protein LOC105213644 [Zeugodacus cucurbitae]|uniref:uncharacterized protein LOC105213644 n=1 Tax=Zeugodacus cucurbitae TaxID=28588 RepID=UPI0005968046|nr:uncharacterized protein LOC105213644 [Zeugodacus cucurbitae]